MPIQVDVAGRKAAIAEATFRVAARDGLRGVTIRSVAAEMGASTTVITNYLPTRADVLINAIDLLGEEWLTELEGITATSEGEAALRRVMRAAVDWDEAALLSNHFWVAVLASPVRSPEIDEKLTAAANAVHAVLERLAEQCGHPDPSGAADLLFMVAQGVFVSTVESPREWTPHRATAIADAAVDAVVVAAAQT